MYIWFGCFTAVHQTCKHGRFQVFEPNRGLVIRVGVRYWIDGRSAGVDRNRDRWRFVPMVGWLSSYDRGWLRGDLIAGIAVAALIVPKNLGYAGIAGIPLQNGLYAAAAGAILYAVFGTSRQISTGPSSGLAAVAASAVVAAKITGTVDVASFVATITLASGVLFLLLAVFRMGWIAQFLSRAVVTGFLFGAAIDVVIGELPKLTGTIVSGSNPLQELRSWFGSIGETSVTTLAVGVVSLAVIFGLRAVAPRIPGALVLVVGGLVASRIFDLGAHGVALVGEVPRGLPTPALPNWSLVTDHTSTIALAALALVLIGFSQTRGRLAGFCRQAPLPNRHQPRVRGSGNVKCRLWSVPGYARVHQPFGQLPQRPFRSTHGPRLPDLRRDRPTYVACVSTAVLQVAQASAGRLDH